MIREEVLRTIEVHRGDFVIDIGGGHRPFHRADLVIEKYPFDHSLHRNQAMQFPPVPVIKADALALPIPDGGCDLVFASHIIEHLPDPARFVAEIQRCSRRVYLEFPARNRELMYAWSFHEWLVEAEGPALKFYRNDLPQLFGPLFHEHHDAALGAWCDQRHEYLNTSIYCGAGELTCEFPPEGAAEHVLSASPRGNAKMNFAETIRRPRYSLRESLAFVAQSLLPASRYENLSRRRNKATSPAPVPDSLLARLMCLECRTARLRREGARIVCPCGAEYVQDRGVFDFDAAARVKALTGD